MRSVLNVFLTGGLRSALRPPATIWHPSGMASVRTAALANKALSWRENVVTVDGVIHPAFRKALALSAVLMVFGILAPVAKSAPGIQWTDIRELGIEGQGWRETKSPYDRLPARAEDKVRAPVWRLSRNSAGIHVRFVTDAASIHARWALTSTNLAMTHMAATGVSGLDLYVK